MITPGKAHLDISYPPKKSSQTTTKQNYRNPTHRWEVQSKRVHRDENVIDTFILGYGGLFVLAGFGVGMTEVNPDVESPLRSIAATTFFGGVSILAAYAADYWLNLGTKKDYSDPTTVRQIVTDFQTSSLDKVKQRYHHCLERLSLYGILSSNSEKYIQRMFIQIDLKGVKAEALRKSYLKKLMHACKENQSGSPKDESHPFFKQYQEAKNELDRLEFEWQNYRDSTLKADMPDPCELLFMKKDK